MLSVVTDAQAHDELRLDLDELVREGARRMLAAALEVEVDAYLAAHAAWQAEYEAFCGRDLSDRDYVYVWADGVHFRGAAGAGSPVLFGDRGRARRRHQGAGCRG